MSKIAFAIVRVSSEIQSTESQISSIISIAKSKGYTIPQGYVLSEKKSGYDESGRDRKTIIELRALLHTNKPDAIFLWELSRLTRNSVKVSTYIDEFSIRPHIPMYFADFDCWTINPATGKEDRNVIMKLVAAAEGVEKERERIKSRTARGREAKAAKGYYIGHLADGYISLDKNNITIDTDRAEVIKRIFSLYNEGYSTYAIKDILNDENIPNTYKYRLSNPFWNYNSTYTGKDGIIKNRQELKWTSASISHILNNEWYCGKRFFKGTAYEIPAIIDVQLFEHIQQKLKGNRIMPKSPNTKNFYLLQGLVHCGNCGRKMYAQFAGLNNHYYCSSKNSDKCGGRGISQDNLDGILHHIIQNRIQLSILGKDNSNFASSFFKNDYARIAELKEEQQKIIKAEDIQRGQLDRELQVQKNYRWEQAHYDKKTDAYIQYSELLLESEQNTANIKSRIAEFENRLQQISSDISKLSSTDSIISKINKIELTEIQQFIKLVVQQVIIHNVDVSIDVIEIDYVNGAKEYAIYSPRLLKCKFIYLNNDFPPTIKLNSLNDVYHIISHNSGGYASEQLPLSYNISAKKLNIREDLCIIKNSEMAILIKKDSIPLIKEGMGGKNYEWDFDEVASDIPLREFISLAKGGKIASIFRGFEHLQPLTEKAKKQQEHYREWRKKYNTGKPTTEPYVRKDEAYAAVKKERRHLYNRIDKIKRNKKKTIEEKTAEISAIRERLNELRFQIHYFGKGKAATKYIKK